MLALKMVVLTSAHSSVPKCSWNIFLLSCFLALKARNGKLRGLKFWRVLVTRLTIHQRRLHTFHLKAKNKKKKQTNKKQKTLTFHCDRLIVVLRAELSVQKLLTELIGWWKILNSPFIDAFSSMTCCIFDSITSVTVMGKLESQNAGLCFS